MGHERSAPRIAAHGAGVGGSDEVFGVEGVLDGAHEYLIFGSAAA